MLYVFFIRFAPALEHYKASDASSWCSCYRKYVNGQSTKIGPKTDALPKFGFVRIMRSRNRTFSHSLESNPNIKGDKNDHMHGGA